MKIVSIDLYADFGFFRKPETNSTINLSYNMMHKPAVLGVLGAILGLEGYREKNIFPEYYTLLKDLPIAIEPLGHDKGNFVKTAIKYTNTVGYANRGTNFIAEELTLVNPGYRIYLMLEEKEELEMRLLTYLRDAKSEFIPYFGKNEFTAWWCKNSFQEYSFEEGVKSPEAVAIKSLFLKNFVLKENRTDNLEPGIDFLFNVENIADSYVYFERLPIRFNEELLQYELGDFAYTTYLVENATGLENLYWLKEQNGYVQFI